MTRASMWQRLGKEDVDVLVEGKSIKHHAEDRGEPRDVGTR